MIPSATLHVGLLSASALLTTALGLYAFRNRSEPGATAFVVLMVILTNWAVTYGLGLLTVDRFWRLVLLRLVWLSTGTIEVWLLLFALAYTGHDRFVTRRTVAALLVIPALVIVATWTNSWHHLFWVEHSIVVSNGLVLVNPTWGPLFWAEVIYTYLLVAVASALLVRLVYQSDYLYTDQSALLLVGIATPFVASALDVFVLSDTPAIDPTPYAFTITGIAFAYALFRRQLFDLVPATRQLGRNAAISQLDAGVVIVDNANRIVYCNAAAERVLGCDPETAVGQDVELLVDESRLDFDTPDALAEIERGDHVYEVRASPITDRRDRRIGNTLVIHDVTAREKRERRLARQRNELETVNDLNAIIRGVNQALVAAVDRDEIERTVCDKVAGSDLYRTACIADIATWSGDADRWTVGGDRPADGSIPTPARLGARFDPDGTTEPTALLPTTEGSADSGTWVVVPLVYGRTVYGALGLYTDRDAVSERERSILEELGETIGHAINAVETRQLLSADAVVELVVECRDRAEPLVAASSDRSCEFELTGFVPDEESGPVAYFTVTDGDGVAEALDAASGGVVSVVRDDDTECLIEWQVTDGALLGTLVDHGVDVREVRADGGESRYRFDIASESGVRSLVDHLDGAFDDVDVVSKQRRTRGAEDEPALTADSLASLTDRQREVLETAYRAGYFNWPRDSNAEEVAETLDIASATLHSHLRKAEDSLLTDLFEGAEDDPE
jgi:PAS domain S-box-containing protein